jgi:hypothetical protein
MADSLIGAIDHPAPVAPTRRARAGTAATAASAFSQHVAAFYPYPTAQEPAARASAEAEGRRGPAPAGRAAGLMKRRHGRDAG